jgi:hypothetical protein
MEARARDDVAPGHWVVARTGVLQGRLEGSKSVRNVVY